MGRPPELKTLTKADRICGWHSGKHRRALFARQRGQQVQAHLSGYGLKTRQWFEPDWICLGFEISRIVGQWGQCWNLNGKPSPHRSHASSWLVKDHGKRAGQGA